MVVSVPLRRRIIPALVISIEDASDAKAALRHAAYALRKTTNKKMWPFLSPPFMEAVFETARFHAGTKGAALHSIVPKELWEAAVAERLAPHADTAERASTNIVPERFILQAEEDERLTRYRGLVREVFAQNASVYICVPTIAEGERLREHLARGIEQYLFLLHSALPKRVLLDEWQRSLVEKHPVVIIGTPAFLTLARKDLHTIIIERENASTYKQQVRPYIDLRVFIEAFARARRARLILGGLPLRIETLYRHEHGELESLVPPKLHPRSGVKKQIVDMREKRDKDEIPKKKTAFKVIGSELKSLIENTMHGRGKIFLFASRRGLSPITVCADCGNTVTCEGSTEPAVLYRGLEQNVFVCQSTGAARSAEERCRICKSWRLQSLGIGTQRIEDEVAELFPDAQLFLLDSDSVKTHRAARAVSERFYRTSSAILIGTEMAFPYLAESLSATAVVSADTLLSHPEWRMSEKAFSLLLLLRDRASEVFLVQTRHPEEPIIAYALSGDTTTFYRNEIASREMLRYPPFSILIKISSVGTPARVEARMQELEKLFVEYKLRVYLPTVRSKVGQYAMHGLLRVPREAWPDDTLLQLLQDLPPHFSVQVDPERLL
jgi:primosomal protein N'